MRAQGGNCRRRVRIACLIALVWTSLLLVNPTPPTPISHHTPYIKYCKYSYNTCLLLLLRSSSNWPPLFLQPPPYFGFNLQTVHFPLPSCPPVSFPLVTQLSLRVFVTWKWEGASQRCVSTAIRQLFARLPECLVNLWKQLRAKMAPLPAGIN